MHRRKFVTAGVAILLTVLCATAAENEFVPVSSGLTGSYRIMTSVYSESGYVKVVLGATAIDKGGIIHFEADVTKLLYSSKPLTPGMIKQIPTISFNAVLTGSELSATDISISMSLKKSENADSFITVDATGSFTADISDASGSITGSCVGTAVVTKPGGSQETLSLWGTFEAWKLH